MLSDKIVKYLMRTFGINDYSGFKEIKITDGLSGAEVYVFQVLKPRRKRDRGTYILKLIDVLGEWYDHENNEVVRSKRIYEEAVNYQENLVRVEKDTVIDDKLVLILSFAFRSEMSSISLAQLRLDNKLELLERVSYDLLKKLNADEIEFVEEGKMIEELCAYRLAHDGNFTKRIRQYVYDIDKSAININGKILPNPYYYVNKLEDILQNKYIQYIKGITHGDLHQKNILTSNNSSKYVVIDYDSCSRNYLLFDQAYLELNSFMLALPECDLEAWMAGMEYAFQVDDNEKESVEYASIIKIEGRVRNGITRWYNEEVPNIIDSFHVQLQLARIAAGINYFSKNGIENQADHIKYLIYVGRGFEALFSLINYEWDRNHVSRLINKEDDSKNKELLWNECGKLRNEYIKILITDDNYSKQKYQKLVNVAEIDWRLIVDVGKRKAPDDLLSVIVPIIKEFNSVKFIDNEITSYISTTGNTGLLQLKEGEGVSSFEHWKMFKNRFLQVIKSICSGEALKSVLFVLDFHGKSLIRERFIEMLWEENLIRKGSRFVCLGMKHELPLQSVELVEKGIKYYEHQDIDLVDFSGVIDDYGLRRKKTSREICLPSLESRDGQLTEAVWNDYNSVVELLYPGMERTLTDYTNGEEFYKGNEITWLDLLQKKDIEWKNYSKWKESLVKKLQMERITVCKLIHGAGAGGTTLSKRLMWDIKDIRDVKKRATFCRRRNGENFRGRRI